MRLSEAILLGSTIMKPCRMGRAVGSSHGKGDRVKTASEERVAHTPTPWRRDPMFPNAIWAGDIWLATTSVDGTREKSAPNAAFIVTACNAHEALVDALRAMEAVLSATFKSQSSIQAMSADEYGEALKAYNQAKSVLKLAGQ